MRERELGIRDLARSAESLGKSFSAYVNQALDVKELELTSHGTLQTDTTLFGDVIGSMLEAFIAGNAISGMEVGELRLVRIVGARAMRPVANIKLDIQQEYQTKGTAPRKRKSQCLETLRNDRQVSHYKKTKIARTEQEIAILQMEEITQQLDLLQMDDGFTTYTSHHFIQIPIRNFQLRLRHGTQYVTIPSLIRLLAAQPWRSLITDALPFRIIQMYDTEDQPSLVRSFISLLRGSMTEYAMARWEKQFWIELPAKPTTHYPDPMDCQFVEQYKQARTLRKSALCAHAKKLNNQLNNLIRLGLLPPAAAHDLGLVLDPKFHVVWMPTRTNLLYDMAIRAARDPCRFYFVFNKFAHSFYEHKYHLAFPELLDTPVPFDLPPMIGKDFFGDALLTKHWPDQSYSDLLADATAEWYLYREQLINTTIEPPITQRFPHQDEFERMPISAFQNCRYAYFNKNTKSFTKEPMHPEDQSIIYTISDTTIADIWQDQPITTTQVEEYIQLLPHMDPLLTSLIPMTPLLLGTGDDDINLMLTDEDAASLSTVSVESELSD